jgi:lysophospholipase L1-like esterase
VYLCGMDVLRKDEPKLIVAIGDSLTDGEPTPVDANQRYPDFLAARYAQERKAVGVVNLGINGGRLLRSLPGPSLLARMDRDALALQGVHAIVTLIGVNDLGIPEFLQRPDEAVSVEGMCMGLEQVARRAQARGVLAVGGTLTPTGGASASLPGYDGAAFEAKRQHINAWLRTSKAFDRLADFDAALRDPAQPSRLLPEYDCGDHLHFSVRGAQVAADTVWKALEL